MMRLHFFLIALSSFLFLGCDSEHELQPKTFFIPDHAITLLKIDDKSIAKDLLWQTIRSGQWSNFFKKGSDQIIDLIQHKEKYGLSSDSPLYFFTYQLNDSTYKSGLIFTIEDSLKLTSSLPIQQNTVFLGNHTGIVAHHNLYLYFNSDSSIPTNYTLFIDSLPSWTNQYSITGVLYQPNNCSRLTKTYLGVQFQDNIMNIVFSHTPSLKESITDISLPNGLYLNTSLQPLLKVDTCLLSKYETPINLLFPNQGDKEALFKSTIQLHWLGWDTITTKEYKTVVNEEFETILKPVYQSHSYPLLKIQTPNDSLSTKLLQWGIHQKIIKKQTTQKYMCVLGVQKSFVYITDSFITYLPEKFPSSSAIDQQLLFSYQPGGLIGMNLQKNPWKKHLTWDQWASTHISSISVTQNTSDYQLSIQFKSEDFALLSLLKLGLSLQEEFNVHNLELP